jgi:hypothetical protein
MKTTVIKKGINRKEQETDGTHEGTKVKNPFVQSEQIKHLRPIPSTKSLFFFFHHKLSQIIDMMWIVKYPKK